MDYKGVLLTCALVTALVSVAGLLTLSDWDEMHVPITDAERHSQAGWEGLGQFPDLPGDERTIGEVFDTTRYYTSWHIDGTSEKIIVGGGYTGTEAWIACGVTKQRFRFYIWDGTGDKSIGGETGWKTLSDDQIIDGVWTGPITQSSQNVDNLPQGFNLKLDGLYVDGSTIRVVYQIKCFLGDWITMTVDEARLIRGDGLLWWDKVGSDVPYIIDEDTHAKLSWIVLAIDSEVTGGPVYRISVSNENTGAIIYDEYIDKKIGHVDIPLTEDMAEEGGENTLLAVLYSEIFLRDITFATAWLSGGFLAPGDTVPMTVDDLPKLNSVTTDKAEYLEGDLATVRINATAGRYPISYYQILCEIGGTIVTPLTKISQPVHQVQVSVAGILNCEVAVFDIYGNPSGVKEVRVTVSNRFLDDWCDDHPTDPACNPNGDKKGINWYESLILGLALLALLLAVLLEVWGLSQISGDVRVYAAVLGTTIAVGLICIAMLFMSFSANGLAAPVMPWDSWW